MTIPKSWLLITGVILLAVAAFFVYEGIQSHDALVRSEAKSESSKQVAESARDDAAQAKKDKEQIQASLTAQIASIDRQRTIVVTPQQAAAVANTLPNLPAQVTVQQVPATATTPATSQIVIPASDIPAFQKYKLDCDASNVNLTACKLNAAKDGLIIDSKDKEIKAVTEDRDQWKSTAKGGTFWHRFRHDAIQITITAGVAYAAGRLSK